MERTMNMRTLHVGIVLLTIVTALIHFSLNFPDPVFILNGIGYLGLLGLLYLPLPFIAPYRRAACWALLGFTVLTILLWVAFGYRSTIGYADKAVEVVLVVLLFVQARSRA